MRQGLPNRATAVGQFPPMPVQGRARGSLLRKQGRVSGKGWPEKYLCHTLYGISVRIPTSLAAEALKPS